jgi:hypothetical protein
MFQQQQTLCKYKFDLLSPIIVKTEPSPLTAEDLAGFFINKKRASFAAEQKLFPFKAIYLLNINYLNICIFIQKSDKSFEACHIALQTTHNYFEKWIFVSSRIFGFFLK